MTGLISIVLPALATSPAGAEVGKCLRGVNIAGAEFGDRHSEYGKQYIYPSDETLDWAKEAGMTAVRLPFLWERLQPELFAEFDTAELRRLIDTVDRANHRGLTVILDVHNYAAYNGVSIGNTNVSTRAFADFWRRLAQVFSNNTKVAFGLMNEPAGITAKSWFDAAQMAIEAIRDTGADNLVLVPGTIWTGASHWFEDQEGGSNAELFKNFLDPQENFAFEFHQYLDEDFSGTHDSCPRTRDALLALDAVTGWMRNNGFRGYLGEFGGTKAPNCLQGLEEMAQLVNSQAEIWIGWSAWAAGDWWGNYPLSLQPAGGVEQPQMAVLIPMLLSPDKSPARCQSMDWN